MTQKQDQTHKCRTLDIKGQLGKIFLVLYLVVKVNLKKGLNKTQCSTGFK